MLVRLMSVQVALLCEFLNYMRTHYLAKLAITIPTSVLLITLFSSLNVPQVHAETVDECVTRAVAGFARENGIDPSRISAEERQTVREVCQEQLNSASPAPASSASARPASANPTAVSPAPVASSSVAPSVATSAAPVGVLPPAPVSAPVGGSTGGNPTIYTGPGFVNVTPFSTFGRVSIDRIINNVINYISGFLATIAVLSLMYGGVLYMTAGGDNGKIGKAKQVIVLTIVGLVIGSFAYMIIIFTTRLFYGS